MPAYYTSNGVMGIKRNQIPKPMWYGDDFADASTYDLFSEDRWGIRVEWDILLEQAKKIDAIVLLIGKHSYPSRLFLSYIDILEANLSIYSDLFYYLIGEHMGASPNPHDFFQKGQAGRIYQRLFFWNLDCCDLMAQIQLELTQVQTHFVECLKQEGLKDLSSRVAKKWYWGFHLDKTANEPYAIIWFKDRAHNYAIEAYREDISIEPLVKQIVNILNILTNAIYFFNLSSELPKNCFPKLLEKFRNSEQGQNLIKAWLYDLDGPRDRLIANMEKTPEFSSWVHRYLHIRKDGEVIEQLFYDEVTGFMLDDKEYYKTENWISILKIATLLREYDERKSGMGGDERTVTKPKKTKRIKGFREFVKDAERTEEIIEKLHRLIGNKTNTNALKIIAEAMWLDLLDRPTSTSIYNEFPTITCSETIISKRLNEPKQSVPKELDKIKKKFSEA